MKKVMFACRKNSCRSQIAEGFAKTLGAGKIAVTSSGLEAAKVHPGAIEVMGEIGIDITDQTSKSTTKLLNQLGILILKIMMPLSPYVVAVSICRKDGFYRKFSRIG